MTWVQNNRFLATLLAIVLLGVGGLGYGIYSAYGRFDEVSQQYNTQAAELLRLQKLTPYPEDANRRKYEDVRKQYDAAVRNLQAQLANESPAPEKISATDFQNRLRDVVSGVTTLARQNNVALPEGFYLGFDPYRVTVPPADAAPLLAMQLKSCEQVARTLISRRVERVTGFRRLTLREEGAAPPAPAPGPGGGNRGGSNNPTSSLVTFYPLEVDFHAPPGAFRDVVDDLLKAQPLYVIRAMRVKNEREKGPGRGAAALAEEGGSPAPAAPVPVLPPPPAGPARLGAIEPPLPDRATLRYIVGTERLDVQMRLELARFSAP